MKAIDWQSLFDVKLALESFPFVIKGIGYTILVSFLSMILGLILSIFLALARSSNVKLLRWPARVYISFMRGTPILVFLFLLYFGIPVMGVNIQALPAAIIGFSLNSAAYMAEINRAAITSIPKGQWEASRALGLTSLRTFVSIILPQAFRIAIPSLGNVFLDLVKSSSLAATISVPELFQKAQIVAGRTMDWMTMIILVALIYWGICMCVSALQEYLEKRYYIEH
ncbi:amino acid ABC transporter permease [Tuberibacillus sp. Marseille-P3662]|uniref:amino acid ABC transporter permease n=1 Tax=Tuberibacillus sp. Marseille-P3662 TaxID=1965358 RepID=UPI000A1C9EC3|nr:amino acid ABC transporter permease [Tuberibacillus sp. Marseille-P3662]